MRKNLSFVITSILLLYIGKISAQISGTVFIDYNMNGIRTTASTGTTPNEPLAAGIIVTAYNATGTVLASYTTTSASAPNFSIPATGTAYNGTLGSNTGFVPSGTAVRLEFTTSTASCPTDNFSYSSRGETSIQFVTTPSTTVLYGLNNPTNYNTGTTGVNAFVPVYINGDPLAGGTSGSSDWFVGFPYTNSGYTAPTQKLNGATIGAVWGVAYSKQANKIFTSALIKRHSGLGTLGSGGIYMLTPTASSFTAVPFFDMDNNSFNTAASPVTRTRFDGTTPAYGNNSSYTITGSGTTITYNGSIDPVSGFPAGLGVVGTNVERGLPADMFTPNFDPAAYGQVGKVGLGDIDISDNGKYLFITNLYQRKVFRLELNNANNPTGVIAVTEYSIPVISVTNGVLRPFGLKYCKDKLYVGAVATGENETIKTPENLFAYVFELQNPLGSATFNGSPVLTIPLNYSKGKAYDQTPPSSSREKWNPWSDIIGGAFTNPQPILSDIEFTDREDMLLNFTDRYGHQRGQQNRIFLSSNITLGNGMIGGDILIAGKSCSTGYAIENNGSFSSNGINFSSTGIGSNQGPGGGEFFNRDLAPDNLPSVSSEHNETSMGSFAVLKGTDNVFLSIMNPLSINSGGVVKFNTSNASKSDLYQLYTGNNGGGSPPNFFGKSVGLGDIELLTPLSPTEIGNRVWLDTDKDGIQDAGEAGIAGVPVQLFLASNLTTPIATATTATDGTYYFTSATGTSTPSLIYGVNLIENTNYVLKFPTTTAGKSITAINSGTNDLIDSDTNASTGEIAFTLGTVGQNDHSFDVGYSTCTPPTATASATQPDCNVANAPNNGGITIAGFTTGQRYQYSTGTTFNSASAIPSSITIIPIGGIIANTLPNNTQNYTVRIYDASDDNCYVDRMVSITPVVIPVANAGNDVTVNCTTPNVTLTATGGGTYLWSNGANSANVDVAPSTTTTYTVTVTSIDGCTATDDVVVTANKIIPSFTVSKNDITCSGAANGIITISATGGTAPYQYSINNGATFQSSNTFNNLIPATYTIKVKDANGCEVTCQ